MSFLNPSVFFSDLRAPTVCSEKKIKPKNFSAQDDLKNLLRARSRRSERALTCGNARAHRCLPNTRPHVFKVNVRNKRKVFSKMLRRVRRVWNISEPTNTCRRYFFKFPAHFFSFWDASESWTYRGTGWPYRGASPTRQSHLWLRDAYAC